MFYGMQKTFPNAPAPPRYSGYKKGTAVKRRQPYVCNCLFGKAGLYQLDQAVHSFLLI